MRPGDAPLLVRGKDSVPTPGEEAPRAGKWSQTLQAQRQVRWKPGDRLTGHWRFSLSPRPTAVPSPTCSPFLLGSVL